MTTEQAKFILSAYRLDGSDDDDPQFVAALEQLKHDPELARWFQEDRAADGELSRHFKREAAPPAHLKAQLLACAGLIRPRPRWQKSRVWAAAALLALLGALAAVWMVRLGQPPLSSFSNQMAGLVEEDSNLIEHFAHDTQSVKAWLGKQRGPADYVLPPGLVGEPSIGCRVLSWRGHKVSLICFMTQNQTVHLFIIEREDLEAAPRENPIISSQHGVGTITWSQDDKTYLLASQASPSLLRSLL